MKLSLQIPIRTQSENVNRRFGNPYARAASTKKERAEVRMFLDSQLPKMRKLLPSGPNFFRVTLVRIGAGLLDDDGLHGALKGVRDEVAAWLECGDGPRDPASWRVGQQQSPPKFYAVRIEIEDEDPDSREVHKVLGPTIERLGPVIGDCTHCGRQPSKLVEVPKAKRAAKAAERRAVVQQAPLVFRRVFYALPEEQHGDELTLRELHRLGDDPPLRINIKGKGMQPIVLQRRLDHDPELGEFWLYEAPASSPCAADEEERRHAHG